MVGGCLLVGAMQLYLWTYDSGSEQCAVRESATAGESASLFAVWSWITEMLIFLVVPLIILIVNILVMREVRWCIGLSARYRPTVGVQNIGNRSVTSVTFDVVCCIYVCVRFRTV